MIARVVALGVVLIFASSVPFGVEAQFQYQARAVLLEPLSLGFTWDQLIQWKNVTDLGISLEHTVTLKVPLIVQVTDCLGRSMPYTSVEFLPALDPGAVNNETAVPNMEGTNALSNSQGVANFLGRLKFLNCSQEGWTFVGRVCPTLSAPGGGGNTGSACAAYTTVVCSDWVRFFIRSNTYDVTLSFYTPTVGDPQKTAVVAGGPEVTVHNLGPTVVGLTVPSFSVKFLSSCGVPMGSRSLVNNTLSNRLSKSTTRVIVESDVAAGTVSTKIDVDATTGLYLATFSSIRVTGLPAGTLSNQVFFNFLLHGDGLVGAKLYAAVTAVAGRTKVAPDEEPLTNVIHGSLVDGTIDVHVSFCKLDLPRAVRDLHPNSAADPETGAALQDSTIMKSLHASLRAHLSDPAHWDIQNATRQAEYMADPLAGKVTDSPDQDIALKTLDETHVYFAYRFSLDVRNSYDAWDIAANTLIEDMKPGELAKIKFYFNRSLVSQTGYGLESTPRGLQYGLQQGMLKQLPIFPLVEYDEATTTKHISYVVPFAIGQESRLHSTLEDFITLAFIQDAFVSPTYITRLDANTPDSTTVADAQAPDVPLAKNPQEQSRVMIRVKGEEISLLGRYRQFSSITALINPDIAYVSTMIVIADCSADVGRELDLSIHPFFVRIGTNPLTDNLVGALVCNMGIVGVVGAVTFLLGKKGGSKNFKAKVFPHYALHISTVLYPGTTYCAYALLPYVHGSWYAFWIFPGFFFFMLIPATVILLAHNFTPQYQATNFDRVRIMSKLFAPLGFYKPTHLDHVKFRFVYEAFRGGQQYFYAADFISWGVTSGVAYFRDCQYRFLGPLVTNVLFFALLVSQAPHITTYRNALAFVSSLVKCIALFHLWWDEQQAKFKTILSAWLVILPLLSLSFVVFEYITQRFLKLDFLINDAIDDTGNMQGFLIIDNLKLEDNGDEEAIRNARRARLEELRAGRRFDMTEEEHAAALQKAEQDNEEQEMRDLQSPRGGYQSPGYRSPGTLSPQPRSPNDHGSGDFTFMDDDPEFNESLATKFEDLDDGWEIVEDTGKGGRNGGLMVVNKYGVPVLDASDRPVKLEEQELDKLRVRKVAQPDVLSVLDDNRKKKLERKRVEADRKRLNGQRRDEIMARLKNVQNKKIDEPEDFIDEDWTVKKRTGRLHSVMADDKSFKIRGTHRADQLQKSGTDTEFLTKKEKDAQKKKREDKVKRKNGEAISPEKSGGGDFDDWKDDIFKPWQSHTDILQEIQQVVTMTKADRENKRKKEAEDKRIERETQMAMRAPKNPDGEDEEEDKCEARPPKYVPRERGILRRLPDGRWVESGLVPKDAAFLLEEFRRRKRMEETARSPEVVPGTDELLPPEDEDGDGMRSLEECEQIIRERRSGAMRRKLLIAREDAKRALVEGPPATPPCFTYEPKLMANVPSKLSPHFRKISDELKAKKQMEAGIEPDVAMKKVKIDRSGELVEL